MSPLSEARDEYQAVGADIITLVELRDGIEQRLAVAIERLGSDPLRYRERLGEVLGDPSPTTELRGKGRAAPARTGRYPIPLMHAVYEFAKRQNGNGFTMSEASRALQEHGYLPQSISPSISRLKQAGVLAHDLETGRYSLTKRGRDEVVIRPGYPLTEQALERLGWLRGKAPRS